MINSDPFLKKIMSVCFTTVKQHTLFSGNHINVHFKLTRVTCLHLSLYYCKGLGVLVRNNKCQWQQDCDIEESCFRLIPYFYWEYIL